MSGNPSSRMSESVPQPVVNEKWPLFVSANRKRKGRKMAKDANRSASAIPTLEDWQHWTLVMGRAQQMMMEYWANSLNKDQPFPPWSPQPLAFPEHTVASSSILVKS